MLDVVPRDDPAAWLRAAVAVFGLPLYRVGALLGIHPTTLSHYCRGRRPMPHDLPDRLRAAFEELRGSAR